MQRKCKCMTEGCGEADILARGLCHSCYGCYSRLVRLGRTTWAKLEKAGKCLKAKKGGRKSRAYELLMNEQ